MSFELNKIAAAIFFAGLIAVGAGLVSRSLVTQEQLAENVYIVEGVGADVQMASATGPTGPTPIAHLLASADIEKGKKVFKKCASCHTVNEGGKTLTGPNLWNVVGMAKAKKDYNYSKAMQAAGGEWDYDALNQYLANPKKYIPKNKMTFAGLKKDSDRAAVVAYLRSLSDSPIPFPTATAEPETTQTNEQETLSIENDTAETAPNASVSSLSVSHPGTVDKQTKGAQITRTGNTDRT